jgi:hypothetical protein
VAHRGERAAAALGVLRPFGRYEANLEGDADRQHGVGGYALRLLGELVPPLQGEAAPATLFVTSFNGAYIGYITNDACMTGRTTKRGT